jgi:hypothetical protein
MIRVGCIGSMISSLCLSMISAQTLRVCREGKPVRVKKTRQSKRLEKAEVQIRQAIADNLDRPRPKAQTFGHHCQLAPQLGLALPDLVSNLTAIEHRESRAGKFPPGVSLPFLQDINIAT